LACTLYLSGEAEVAVSMVASRSFFTIATKKLLTICLSQMEEIAPIAPIVASVHKYSCKGSIYML
jgi:hypothetical protein